MSTTWTCSEWVALRCIHNTLSSCDRQPSIHHQRHSHSIPCMTNIYLDSLYDTLPHHIITHHNLRYNTDLDFSTTPFSRLLLEANILSLLLRLQVDAITCLHAYFICVL